METQRTKNIFTRVYREERGLNSQKIRKIFDNYHQEEPRKEFYLG